MALPEGTGGKLDPALAEETAARLRALKAGLSPEAVEALAREVINRVVQRAGYGRSDVGLGPSPEDIDRLAFALIDGNQQAGQVFIEDLRSSGISVEDVMLDYLAAAARRLGDWWNEDHISFMDATLGTARIYGILRVLDSEPATRARKTGRSALFMSVPGEQHTLGVRMAADVFRRRGWEIELLIGRSHDELLEAAGASSHIIIGVSAGGMHSLVSLARLVLALRIHRPDASILISGSLVDEAAESVSHLSPDGVAPDLERAVEVLDALWERHAIAGS